MSIHTTKSDILWNYLSIALSLGANVLWLPLLLVYLSPDLLGVWYIFLSIGGIVTLFDFGFFSQFMRAFTYGWSGVEDLQGQGIQTAPVDAPPNFALLAATFRACRILYLGLALLALAAMLGFGTLYLRHVIPEASLYEAVQPAWIIYAVSVFLNLYLGYYLAALRGLGDVAGAGKANVYGKMAMLLFGSAALVAGFGILGLAVTNLFVMFVPRYYARYRLEHRFRLRAHFHQAECVRKYHARHLLTVLWHNAWRDGLVSVNEYLTVQATTLLCGWFLTLAETGVYSISLQVISSITGIAAGMMTSCLPAIVSGIASRAMDEVRRLVALSMTSLYALYALGVIAFLVAGVPILHWIRPSFSMDAGVFGLLALHMFLMARHRRFACFIAASNTLPYTLSFIVSGLAATAASYVSMRCFALGVYGLILPPLVIQMLYNNWRWPQYFLRSIGLSEFSMLRLGWHMIRDKLHRKRLA